MAAPSSTTRPRAPELHEHPAVAAARLRQKCERAVDRLLQILDELGGDPDMEPSLGLPEPQLYRRDGLDQTGAPGGTDDREDDPSDDEHPCGWEAPGSQMVLHGGSDHLEPSLGSLGGCCSADRYDQRRWARGKGDDLEEEHDGTEPEECFEEVLGWSEGESLSGKLGYPRDDNEPSLGSTNNMDQRLWAEHEDPKAWLPLDGELQCEDEGGDPHNVVPDYHPDDQRLMVDWSGQIVPVGERGA